MEIPDKTFYLIKKLALRAAMQTRAVDAKERSRAALTTDDLLTEIVKADDAARYEAQRKSLASPNNVT